MQSTATDNNPASVRFFDILLVEDSNADAMLIERAFGQNTLFDYKFSRAPTVSDALRMLAERQYSIVLLDYSLPDSIGFDGLLRIHERAPGTPVVMVTAYADEDAALESMERGAQDWLSKSLVTPQSLMRATRYAIQRQYLENIKNEFVSIVSHELRTPITSMRGSLGLVLGAMSGELPEKVQRLLIIARDNCERLVTIVNDILDTDEIGAGGMRLSLVAQSARELTEKAMRLNEASAIKAGVRLELRQGDADVQMIVDAERYLHVLSNLLSNAIKVSPEGASVEVFITVDRGFARVHVKDSGPGIPEAFRAHIFEKFTQAEPCHTRKNGGVGLGLYIVKLITTRMNGQVGFESDPGNGATFWVEFPLADGK